MFACARAVLACLSVRGSMRKARTDLHKCKCACVRAWRWYGLQVRPVLPALLDAEPPLQQQKQQQQQDAAEPTSAAHVAPDPVVLHGWSCTPGSLVASHALSDRGSASASTRSGGGLPLGALEDGVSRLMCCPGVGSGQGSIASSAGLPSSQQHQGGGGVSGPLGAGAAGVWTAGYRISRSSQLCAPSPCFACRVALCAPWTASMGRAMCRTMRTAAGSAPVHSSRSRPCAQQLVPPLPRNQVRALWKCFGSCRRAGVLLPLQALHRLQHCT